MEVGHTSLHLAAERGDADLVSKILRQRPDRINAHTHKKHITPLHYAVLNNNYDVVKRLLDAGASVNFKTRQGIAPLHLVSSVGVFELLMLKSADLQCVTNQLETPLHWAAMSGNKSLIRAMVMRGADIKARTAEHYLAGDVAPDEDKIEIQECIDGAYKEYYKLQKENRDN